MIHQDQLLILVAREAILNCIKNKNFHPDFYYKEVAPVNGVFVTLWKMTGTKKELRGCIGRHMRRFKNLAEEIADCAIESAMHDPRFEPLKLEELNSLKIEVSLLGEPQIIKKTTELDPKKLGVIVQQNHRQATLLPDIEGVDTIEEQLRIVKNKAGIWDNQGLKIYKFEVKKIEEN